MTDGPARVRKAGKGNVFSKAAPSLEVCGAVVGAVVVVIVVCVVALFDVFMDVSVAATSGHTEPHAIIGHIVIAVIAEFEAGLTVFQIFSKHAIPATSLLAGVEAFICIDLVSVLLLVIDFVFWVFDVDAYDTVATASFRAIRPATVFIDSVAVITFFTLIDPCVATALEQACAIATITDF